MLHIATNCLRLLFNSVSSRVGRFYHKTSDRVTSVSQKAKTVATYNFQDAEKLLLDSNPVLTSVFTFLFATKMRKYN